jgi:putative hydrolase of HD superfamily
MMLQEIVLSGTLGKDLKRGKTNISLTNLNPKMISLENRGKILASHIHLHDVLELQKQHYYTTNFLWNRLDSSVSSQYTTWDNTQKRGQHNLPNLIIDHRDHPNDEIMSKFGNCQKFQPIILRKMSTATSVLQFLRIVGNLKKLKRTGWVNNHVHEPETVASHMYRMAIISMITPHKDSTIDINKCIKMSLVHDLGEALVGDITPYDGVSEEDKYEREKAAFLKITGKLEEIEECKSIGEEIYSLWLEFEQGKTQEAQLVKEIDKFDMVLQADQYETEQGKDLESFFKYCNGYFKVPFMADLAKQLYQERQDRKDKK